MRHRLLALAATAAVSLPAIAASPYAGQEARELKALSASEVQDYLEGRGMGFAKPAELNGYPGPMHVLELADSLGLSDEQRRATRELMDRHKAEVRALGREYVEAERALEALFRERTASAEAITQATAKAAALQARIRASHLATHLEQARLLRAAQVQRYAELRGYGLPASGDGGHGHGHGGRHRH